MMAGGAYKVGYPGVGKNRILARRYYEQALELGHHYAQRELDEI